MKLRNKKEKMKNKKRNSKKIGENKIIKVGMVK